MRELTEKQSEVLALIRECEVKGVCIRYMWRWLSKGRDVTPQVRSLLSRGIVHATYYRNDTAGIYEV